MPSSLAVSIDAGTEHWLISRYDVSDSVDSDKEWKQPLFGGTEVATDVQAAGGTQSQQYKSEKIKTESIPVLCPSGFVTGPDLDCHTDSVKPERTHVENEDLDITEAGTGQLSNPEPAMEIGMNRVMAAGMGAVLPAEQVSSEMEHLLSWTSEGATSGNVLNLVSTSNTDKVTEECNLSPCETKEVECPIGCETVSARYYSGSPSKVSASVVWGHPMVSSGPPENNEVLCQTVTEVAVKDCTEGPLALINPTNLKEKLDLMEVGLEMETDINADDKETEQAHFSDAQFRQKQCDPENKESELLGSHTKARERREDRQETVKLPVMSEDERTSTGKYHLTSFVLNKYAVCRIYH